MHTRALAEIHAAPAVERIYADSVAKTYYGSQWISSCLAGRAGPSARRRARNRRIRDRAMVEVHDVTGLRAESHGSAGTSCNPDLLTRLLQCLK
jgi:hypothetical protein